MIAAIAVHVVLYAKTDWRGGLSFGPRYMTDVLPFLVWMLVPVVAALRGVPRALFKVAVGCAIAVEAIGAFCYTDALDVPIYAADVEGVHDMRGAWQWRNTPILTSLRHGLMPAELRTELRGSFDVVQSSRGLDAAIMAGEPAFAGGWALAGDATPWQVAVAVDGRQIFATGVFVDRPDVRQALHVSSLSGWRIGIDTAGLTPGEHHLTALAWADARGHGTYLAERTLRIRGGP
jgi:hypothetical protein